AVRERTVGAALRAQRRADVTNAAGGVLAGGVGQRGAGALEVVDRVARALAAVLAGAARVGVVLAGRGEVVLPRGELPPPGGHAAHRTPRNERRPRGQDRGRRRSSLPRLLLGARLRALGGAARVDLADVEGARRGLDEPAALVRVGDQVRAERR